MAKQRPPIRDIGEYAGARALVWGFAALPRGASIWLGERLGDLWRALAKRRRIQAEKQVRDRLGLGEEEAEQFIRRNFRHYGNALAEFSWLSRMVPEDFRALVDFEDFEKKAAELRAEGKGVVFITAHFGNWEWFNSLAAITRMEGGSIARPLENARLNEFIRSIRERNGLRIFDKKGAIRKALRALNDNNVVGVLIDQDAGKGGVMSPFLGSPASTITVPVELAIRTGAPILVAVLKRLPPGSPKRFQMRFSPHALRAENADDSAAEARRLVDFANRELGDLIREAPEQWFWIHRRWKTQPPQSDK